MFWYRPVFCCRSETRPPEDDEEEEEEILGSDDDEQEDPKDYVKGKKKLDVPSFSFEINVHLITASSTLREIFPAFNQICIANTQHGLFWQFIISKFC